MTIIGSYKEFNSDIESRFVNMVYTLLDESIEFSKQIMQGFL